MGNTTANYPELESLAVALAQAKATEDQAKQARVAAEEALIAKAKEFLDFKPEGSTSFKAGQVKVTVKRGFSLKVLDMEKFKAIFPTCVKTKEELDTKMYNLLTDADRVKASEFVQATAKKDAVELKL